MFAVDKVILQPVNLLALLPYCVERNSIAHSKRYLWKEDYLEEQITV